jgi:hypothetical protein
VQGLGHGRLLRAFTTDTTGGRAVRLGRSQRSPPPIQYSIR